MEKVKMSKRVDEDGNIIWETWDKKFQTYRITSTYSVKDRWAIKEGDEVWGVSFNRLKDAKRSIANKCEKDRIARQEKYRKRYERELPIRRKKEASDTVCKYFDKVEQEIERLQKELEYHRSRWASFHNSGDNVGAIDFIKYFQSKVDQFDSHGIDAAVAMGKYCQAFDIYLM